MPVQAPFTHRPEDIGKLLQRLQAIEVPAAAVGPEFFKKLGFTAASAKYLFNILKKLGFIDVKDRASASWIAFAADEKRGLVLASAVKLAYADLFKFLFCPYLEDDAGLFDYFKHTEKATTKEIDLAVLTFRALCESADFQDVLCEEGSSKGKAAVTEINPAIKVDPNLQITLQIHIDPTTPDEKIEVIFKNMRKYLLGQES